MLKPVKKAVFPVAGLGTRFLPATKANPKEMLPIVDKPLIQYAVEEAVAAGVEHLIFVTNSSKRAIEDHFDSNYELEEKLAKAGKLDLLAAVRGVLPKGVSCAYIRQPDALGLGHAVLCARPIVGDEPFALLLADDLIEAAPQNCLQQMLSVYHQTGHSVIAVEPISHSETQKYGVIATDNVKDRVLSVSGIVEKPAPAVAPSNLGVVGRYILTPHVFRYLEQIQAGAGGEYQLTDALASLLLDSPVYALQFAGVRYDCGSKLGYLQATVSYALQHDNVASDFRAYLKQVIA